MTNEHFTAIFEEIVNEAKKIHATKGVAYANGGDRLGNFKRAAEKRGIQPETICAIYREKHEDSINFVNRMIEEKGEIPETGEALISRFVDVINYYALNYALIVERQEKIVAENPAVRDNVTGMMPGDPTKLFE